MVLKTLKFLAAENINHSKLSSRGFVQRDKITFQKEILRSSVKKVQKYVLATQYLLFFKLT